MNSALKSIWSLFTAEQKLFSYIAVYISICAAVLTLRFTGIITEPVGDLAIFLSQAIFVTFMAMKIFKRAHR